MKAAHKKLIIVFTRLKLNKAFFIESGISLDRLLTTAVPVTCAAYFVYQDVAAARGGILSL